MTLKNDTDMVTGQFKKSIYVVLPHMFFNVMIAMFCPKSYRSIKFYCFCVATIMYIKELYVRRQFRANCSRPYASFWCVFLFLFSCSISLKGFCTIKPYTTNQLTSTQSIIIYCWFVHHFLFYKGTVLANRARFVQKPFGQSFFFFVCPLSYMYKVNLLLVSQVWNAVHN